MGKLQQGARRHKGNLGKRVVVVALSGVLLIQPVGSLLPQSWHGAIISQAYASEAGLKLKSQSIVSAGIKRLDYTFTTTRSGKSVSTAVHVIEADLSKPYVSLNTISGRNGSVGQRNNILNMTKESGAVAGINGDVFVMANEGTALGAQVQNGVLTTSPSQLRGMYSFAVTSDRKPVIDSFSFAGTVTAENGGTFPLEGVNQSTYFPEIDGATGVTYSHVDKLFIYTSVWGGAERPAHSATIPTEALIVDGVVTQLSDGVQLDVAPPVNGYILRGSGKAAQFIKQNLIVGQRVDSQYALVSNTTKLPVDPASFQMLIGGHTLLVDNGTSAAFSRDVAGVSGNSYTSRSGVGYSQDGQKVYLITSERSGSNTGLSLKELQTVMVGLGVFKGINLDGGGSTTMTERQLATTNIQLSHPTQESSQRSVANGIGVFTAAPQGTLKGMVMNGTTMLLLGQEAKFSVNGYDNYYNPIAIDTATMEWSLSSAVGTLKDGVLTANKIGKTQVIAKSGSVEQKMDVEVVGQESIASMSISASAGMLSKGATLNVPVTAKLKNGSSYTLSGDALKWEFVGFKGEYNNGVITVTEVKPGVTTGYAIARYDGFGAMVPFVQGEQDSVLEDFEVSRYGITSQVTPADTTTGSVKLVSDLPDQKSSRALQISYDFSGGTGTRASYAVFGSNGLTMGGSPAQLTMDVFSDNSKNWVRAEIVDASGKTHLLDVAKELNWSGWRNVKIDLSSAGVKFPAKLKRVYVVTIDKDSDKKAASGAIAIDNLMLRTPSEVKEPARSSITMTVGNTNASVSGKGVKLEAAPLLQNGTTYVPIRFVSEAMGAEVLYDPKTRKVSVLRGKQLLEMTIGKKEYTLNGVRYTSDVAPFTQNGRTMIPIRLFSEKLGFKVNYEEKLRKITID